jgi:hypothetical protein
MILGLHIVLALASLAFATFTFFRPSETKLTVSYLSALGTLASGALLIIINNASILRTCLTGILFFAVVSVLNELARKRLALQATE